MNNLCIAESYTFTNASATGENGPTQNQINSEYTGTNLANSVTINSQGIQEWVVPASGTYEIEVWGAQGGSGGWYSNSSYSSIGGLGGYAKGSVTLSAGTTVYIHIGQQGEGYTSSNIKMTDSPGIRAGGWNGGGGNSKSSAPGTGGGGASDVRVGGTGLNNRIIVAGGGGGGGNSGSNTQLSNGGNGGGLTATTLAASTQYSNRTPGSGATQNSGNALGIGATANHNLSGGGGGGYYGGGAGDNSTGGGGGSSYLGGVSNGTTQSGIRSGHGKVVITSAQLSNSPPVISQSNSSISKSLNEDSSTTWASDELNATDPDTNASHLSWSIINPPSNGTTTIDGNGSSPALLNYQPNADFFGSDTFTVQVSDGENNDSVVVNLTVTPINDPPSLSGDFNATLAEDGNASGDINATDLDGLTDGSYFAISSNPSNGSATIDQQTGSWSYSPQANFFGSDSFSVSITDDLNNSSTLSISLIISSVNDLTILSGDFNATLPEDGNASGDINATDLDGLTDGSYFAIASNPSNGSATIDQQTGSWSYSPQANFFGSDSFSLSITDDLNNSSTQSISLIVSPVNDVTILSGDFNATLAEDGNANGDINATDPDGLTDGSYFAISSNPSNGSATIDQQTGSWSYSPQANFFGSDSFSLSITDDLNNSSTQSISLIVSPVNDVTILSGDFNATLAEDGNANGDINATDPDGLTDGSYFAISSNPSNGSATIDQQTGSWSYSPQANFFGSDSFSLSITDDLNNSSTQSISLIVSSVNDLTILSGDFNATLPEDGNASGDINATDLDGLTDGSYFAISSNPSNGSATIDQQTGSWSYSPQANFFGSDSFSLSITDDLNNSSTQSISLIVSSVNDLTILSGDFNATLPEDGNASGDINATDLDGLTDGSYFAISSNPSNGSATIDQQTGSWSYSPQANFFGSDSFTVSITDDLNNSSTQSISLIVSPVNDLPYNLKVSNNQLLENLPPNTFVGVLSAEDIESNQSISFSTTDGIGDKHNQLFNIDSNRTLRTTSILDFESNQTLQIRIKAMDVDGGEVVKIFEINLLNIVEDFDNDGIENYFDFDDDNDSFSDAVEIAYGSDPLNPDSVANQAPTEISISNNTFYESQAIGLFVGKLFAVDPDDNATLTFSFVDGNNSPQNQLFEIDSNQSLRTKSLFKFIKDQNDFKIRVKVVDQFNAAFEQVLNIQTLKDESQSIRLGKPLVSIDANGRATIVCPVSNEGNESLPTIQYLVSETDEFSNASLTLGAIFDQGSVTGSLFNLDENKTYYTRAITTHKGRSIISESTQFNTSSILAFNWWSIFEESQAGWRNSVWLGTFLPHESGWIYHQSIGWLYAHPGQEDDFWFWSQDYKWLWTKEGIYPFLYRNNTSNWLYILGQKDGKAVFHDYSVDQGI